VVVLADEPREVAQDAGDLVALRALRLAEPVRMLHDGERLDEQRLPRPRAVVDDAGDRAACGRPEGEDGPAAALGHEVVLQMLAQRRVARERLQAFREPGPPRPELAAEPAEGGGRAVPEIRAVVLDRLRDCAVDARQRRLDPGRDSCEARDALLALERRARGQRRVDRDRDRAECTGIEHAAACRDLRRRPNVADPGEIRFGRPVEERDGLGRQRLTRRDLIGVGRRQERQGLFPAGLARRRAREAIEDLGQLQQLQGPRIHRAQCRTGVPTPMYGVG
jgi:hypothetical protein